MFYIFDLVRKAGKQDYHEGLNDNAEYTFNNEEPPLRFLASLGKGHVIWDRICDEATESA